MDEDQRLAIRALREAWPVPTGRRAELVERVFGLALDPKTSARDVIAALKALAAVSRVNLGTIDTAIRADEYDQVMERIDALEAAGSADGSPSQAD